MCLTVKTDIKSKRGLNKLEPQIATQSMYVWKRFTRPRHKDYTTLRSPHRDAIYDLNSKNIVEQGLEIYPCQSWVSDKWGYKGYVHQGIHAYTNEKMARDRAKNSRQKVIKCRIPRGAKYFIGLGDEIVSDKLILPDKSGEFSRYPKKRIW